MQITEIVQGILEGRFNIGATIAAATGEKFYVVSEEKFLLIPAGSTVYEFEKIGIRASDFATQTAS